MAEIRAIESEIGRPALMIHLQAILAAKVLGGMPQEEAEQLFQMIVRAITGPNQDD